MPISATLAKIIEEMMRVREERGSLLAGAAAGAGGGPDDAGCSGAGLGPAVDEAGGVVGSFMKVGRRWKLREWMLPLWACSPSAVW